MCVYCIYSCRARVHLCVCVIVTGFEKPVNSRVRGISRDSLFEREDPIHALKPQEKKNTHTHIRDYFMREIFPFFSL